MSDIPKDIWLIEDEKAYADSLTYILSNISGLRCRKHFYSSEELLDYLHSPQYTQAPDLVLMDIRLPGKSGIDTVKLLNEELKDIPVVMLTLYDDKKYIVDAMKAGAVGYIVKGDPFDQVVDVIRQAMNGRMLLSKPVKTKLLEHLHETESQAFELTSRQKEVLTLMCEGLSKADIAARLSITLATADNHFRHIYQRLGVNSAHAAVALAFREGLVAVGQ